MGGYTASGQKPIKVTRLSQDTAEWEFQDTLLAVVPLNSIQVDVIDFGHGIGAVLVFLETDTHNWAPTGPPYRLTCTKRPEPPTILDRAAGVGTVFGSGKFTETGGGSDGSCMLKVIPPGFEFTVTNGVQPENNFCDWAGQVIFLYT